MKKSNIEIKTVSKKNRMGNVVFFSFIIYPEDGLAG